jgi:hypothetical protein
MNFMGVSVTTGSAALAPRFLRTVSSFVSYPQSTLVVAWVSSYNDRKGYRDIQNGSTVVDNC